MSNDIGEFSSEILYDQALTIARLRAKCERLEVENTQLSKVAEEYRLKIPTTAQAMVYMDLLQKHERLEAQCAEMRSALEKLSKLGNEPMRGNSIGNQIAQQVLDSTDCGKSIVKRLKEARWLIEHSICRPEHDQRRDQWLKGQP